MNQLIVKTQNLNFSYTKTRKDIEDLELQSSKRKYLTVLETRAKRIWKKYHHSLNLRIIKKTIR